MLDIGWSEMLVIAAIAIIVVGPKDLPGLLRTIGRTFGQVRRMANEFTGQFNEALREAEFDEINRSVKELGKSNPLKQVAEDLKADLDKSVKDIPGQIGQTDQGEKSKQSASSGTVKDFGKDYGKKPVVAAAGAEAAATGSEAAATGTEAATERTVQMRETPVAPAHSLGSGGHSGSHRSVIEKAEQATAQPNGAAAATPAGEARRPSVAERADKAWKSAVGDDSSA